MSLLAFILSAQLLLFATFLLSYVLQFVLWARAFRDGDRELSSRAARREHEIHDSEHDIHLT